MQKEITELTEDQFDEQFTRVENHIDTNASWDGCMFETYGKELEFVKLKAQTTKTVWTIVEGDDDTLYYSNGMRFVNRIGYFITNEPWDGEIDVRIDISMD